MSADTDVPVFDMSSQSEGTPSTFVKKDYLSTLDNQSQSYQGSQCTVDTSQPANSNKCMNYREAYLSIPLLITATATNLAAPTSPAGSLPATVPDFAFGLKNWLGSVVHSITLD